MLSKILFVNYYYANKILLSEFIIYADYQWLSTVYFCFDIYIFNISNINYSNLNKIWYSDSPPCYNCYIPLYKIFSGIELLFINTLYILR